MSTQMLVTVEFDQWQTVLAAIRDLSGVVGVSSVGVEFAWMADADSQYHYDSREEAEEYMGNPEQFYRMAAGPWTSVRESMKEMTR